MIESRIMRNRAPIGATWRAQVGYWRDNTSQMTGKPRRKFEVLMENWFHIRKKADEWAVEHLEWAKKIYIGLQGGE